MAKIQNYTIVFKEPQTEDVTDAMYSVGSGMPNAIRNHIQSQILEGNITNEQVSLSSNGLTLKVSRTWTDSAYNTFIDILSESEILTTIQNMSHVSSATYGFSDS